METNAELFFLFWQFPGSGPNTRSPYLSSELSTKGYHVFMCDWLHHNKDNQPRHLKSL